MKYLFSILLSLICLTTFAQTVHYTRHMSRYGVDDGVIIVPEIGGKNHLWIVGPEKDVRLQVYNFDMDWEREQILPIKIADHNDVTIIPLKKEYYFYNQSASDGANFLWRIDASGNATDVSRTFKNLIKTTFKDNTTTCQMLSRGGSIYVFSNMYYPDLKKVVSTIIKTDDQLNVINTKHYASDFDHNRESLHKIIIDPEVNITILKKQSTTKYGYVLDLLKINLKTDQVYEANFNSNTPFSVPEIIFNSLDSSTTVYSMMSRTYTKGGIVRHMFLATLNDTLGEITKAKVLKLPLDEDMPGAFTYINVNGNDNWLPILGNWNAQYLPQAKRNLYIGLNRMVTLQSKKIVVVNATSFQPRLQSIHPDMQLIFPPGDVKVSVINQQFNNVRDTVFKYHRRNYIEVAQYSSFIKNKTSYLIVKERFPSNGKGLLLLHLNSEGGITPSPLRLYERFHYALPQLQQTSGGNVLIPYAYKGEVGMVYMNIKTQG